MAIGDSETKIASPFGVIAGGNDGFAEIKHIVHEEGIDAIVVGVPKSAGDFHNSDQLEKTKLFIDRLIERTGIPVYDVDESFTSVEAQRLQREEGAKAEEDALAAMLLLEQYFNSME